MTEIKPGISLDRPITYKIIVPGPISNLWTGWQNEMEITVLLDDNDLPTTSLIATIDQAGLHGLLSRLYSLGLPLISVNIVEVP